MSKGSRIWERASESVVSIRTLTRFMIKESSDERFIEEGIYNYTTTGTGFAIPGGFFITCAHTVYLGKMRNDESYHRVPPPTSYHARVERVWLQIYGDISYMYEADIVGIDPAGDIAILTVNPRREWNSDLPLVDVPSLNLGNNRRSRRGDTVWTVGDPLGINSLSISKGVLRDNKYLDRNGHSPQELIAIDSSGTFGSSGSPILNSDAEVIGMISFNVQQTFDFIAGPSSTFMLPVVESFIRSNAYTYTQDDAYGNFLMYNKGYLGIRWKVADVINYVFRPNSCNLSLVNTPRGPGHKIVEGVIVIQLDGEGKCSYDSGTRSPLIDLIEAGDVITHLDGISLGSLVGQYSPAMITWNKLPGDIVSITFRPKSENYSTAYTIDVNLASFPESLDKQFPDAI